MSKQRKYFFAHFNYIGCLKLDRETVNACSHSGSCDQDVQRNSELRYIAKQLNAIDPEALKKDLKEYGAWAEKELSDHNQNLQRILWIAAGDIMDSNNF